jgi:two-component system, cell cycle response regulator DivK
MKPVILVVEDNERNRKLVRTILEFRGYEIVELEDGEPAVATAKACKPVLVLMDIELPKVDGITALGMLRADAETAHIPVAAVTASVTPSERERVQSAGFNAYIAKPIDVTSFAETVDRLTGRVQTDA